MTTTDTRAVAEDLGLHRQMCRIRAFEEQASRLYRDQEIPGFLHLSIGQESTAVGACAPLRDSDGIVSTHRGHGHCIAKGVDITAMFAELMGRESGTCGGFGGSMHIADIRRGVYGANGIVGAGLPVAVGVATGFRMQGRDDVVVAFFGDGAAATGAFHEAVNLAVLWRLPVLFLCENNHFAEFSPAATQHPVDIATRAAGYGLTATCIDGNDVRVVNAAVTEAVASMRNGDAPFLIEATTYRWHGHYEGDPQTYRSQEEVAEWKARDPLAVSAARIDNAGAKLQRRAVEDEVDIEIAAALSEARSAGEPSPSAIHDAVERARPRFDERGEHVNGEPFRVMDAVNEALVYEMDRHDDLWLAGIDIAAGGGIFGVTKGISRRFPSRTLDTPISESAIIGLAVGGAMAGTRPVVELMFLDFLGVCFDQLLNQAAKLHFMTGGAAPMSLVVRTQFGGGRSSGAQHSQSLEAVLAHIPGLTVVMPSTPSDTYGLLRAAIADPNPVVVIEHRNLYGMKEPRPADDHIVPVGKALVRRTGSDATLVTWSRMVHESMKAATMLAERGIDVEVIDLRTVRPIDMQVIDDSVRKTSRLAVAHEAVESGGLGAEIVARVARETFWHLDAPLVRIAPPFTPTPYAPVLEKAWLPNHETIASEIAKLVAV